jgi:hypothetical protein
VAGFEQFLAGRPAPMPSGAHIRTLEQAAQEGESNPLGALAVNAYNRARYTQPPAPDAISVGDSPEQERIVLQAEPPASAGQAATAAAPAAATNRRVAFYVAKNDLFSVVVESAPDWEPVDGYKPLKLPASEIVEHIEPLLRALGIKTIDRTAGDLEEAYEGVAPHSEEPVPMRRRRSS